MNILVRKSYRLNFFRVLNVHLIFITIKIILQQILHGCDFCQNLIWTVVWKKYLLQQDFTKRRTLLVKRLEIRPENRWFSYVNSHHENIYGIVLKQRWPWIPWFVWHLKAEASISIWCKLRLTQTTNQNKRTELGDPQNNLLKAEDPQI